MAANHSATTSLSEQTFRVGQKFNPYGIFNGIFIPEALVRHPAISPTAKLAYGRLVRYAGQDGRCFPAVATLAAEIGVKKRRAQDCLTELETAGLLAREFQKGRSSHYAFLWHPVFEGKAPMQNPARVGMHDTARGPVRVAAPEDSHHQGSQKKESHGALRRQSGPVRPGPTEAKATPRPKPLSLKADDERPTPRLPLGNPEMEFRARIAERHGTVLDADDVLRDVRCALDGVPLTEFLEADLKATTAPRSLRNPHGHYRALAHKVGRRKETAALEGVAETLRQGQEFLKQGAPGLFKPPCACNDGKLPGGGYCNCKTGGLRRQLDARAIAGFGPSSCSALIE